MQPINLVELYLPQMHAELIQAGECERRLAALRAGREPLPRRLVAGIRRQLIRLGFRRRAPARSAQSWR